MTGQLIENVRMLSDIKQSRHFVLSKIQRILFDQELDAEKLMTAILNLSESAHTRALLIQILGKTALRQPQIRDAATIFIKKLYKSIKNEENESIAEALLFFFFLIDRTYLLSLNFQDKKLMALRTRFLFISDELSYKFIVPERDILAGQRIITLDRLCDNLVTMADTTRFAQFKDFVSFCCKFPFITDMNFLRSWSGIKSPAFFKEITSSRLFLHDGVTIIYHPAERVKSDKFVYETEVQKKVYEAIREQKELIEKKQLFERFVDSFISMSNILNDIGICAISYNGQHRFNRFAEALLSPDSNSEKYINSLTQNYTETGRDVERFIIDGINIEAKISQLSIDGKDIGYIVILKDITENEINKMFSAHDFKNSFNSVITTFRLLKEAPCLQDEDLKCLISGEKSIFKLKDQFEEIVSFRSDKLHLDHDIDLCNVLNKTIISAGSVLTAKMISLDFQQAGDTILVTGDEKKLSRIFENIISNAVKYSPENSRIRVYIQQNENMISTFIEDEGYGIEDSFGDKIFKMGVRQDRDKHKVIGSGLGLAIVKKFVSMHGGTISFSKNPVQGTTFKVSLPPDGPGSLKKA